MRKFFLVAILTCISTVSSVVGQCEFPVYDKYGLVCEEAQYLCGYELNGFNGSLLSTKSPLPQPDPLCAGAGEADNIQWFSFVADDVNIELVIRYSNCTGNILDPGLQVGIFENCELASDLSPLGSIYCVEDVNYSDIVLTPDPLDIEVGQLYLLFIDGYAGSACDFEIEVVQGVCTDVPDSSQPCTQDCGVIAQFPGNAGCTMFRDNFSFAPSSQIIADMLGCNPTVDNTRLDSIVCIEWEITPDMGYNFITSSVNFYDSLEIISTVTVEWTVPGVYMVKPILTINPLFSTCQAMCDCSDDVAYTITVTESTINTLPQAEICPGECVDFCGQTFCEAGDEVCYNRDECLIEYIAIVETPNIEIDEGEFFLCGGNCFEFQGVEYCEPGSYAVSNATSCDTTYLFELDNLIFTTSLVQDDAVLNCEISQANLEGSWNTNFSGNVSSVWIFETGDTVSTNEFCVATKEGHYLYIAWPEGFENCSKVLPHVIVKDEAIPVADLDAPFLDCTSPSQQITVNTLNTISSAIWTGPNGFTSNDIHPLVGEIGNYEVELTGANGCSLILSVEVDGDFAEPEVDLAYDNLTCSEEIPTSSFTTNSSIISHQWSLPDGSTSDLEILNLDDLGNYTLDVVGDNGCVETLLFEVMDLTYDPSLGLNEDRIWRCNDSEIDLDLSSQKDPNLTYLWTTLEGGVISNDINVVITGPGTYVLTSIDEEIECIGVDTVKVLADPNPFVDVQMTAFAPTCKDQNDGSIEIDTLDGGEGPYSFEVNGETVSDLSNYNFETGNYMISIIDVFGCAIEKEIQVPEPEEFSIDIDDELEIRFGQEKTITFDTNIEEDEISFIEWTDENGEVLGQDRTLDFVGAPIEYINLRVENIDGCEVLSQVRIDLSFEVDIYFPNVFSPNNDGKNDLFVFYNNGYPENADNLKIFDRSGELIYTSSQTVFNDNQIGWDGTFNGRQCQPGVYVFMLDYTLMNGQQKTLSGTITLVR